jgi:hypothetical protein
MSRTFIPESTMAQFTLEIHEHQQTMDADPEMPPAVGAP